MYTKYILEYQKLILTLSIKKKSKRFDQNLPFYGRKQKLSPCVSLSTKSTLANMSMRDCISPSKKRILVTVIASTTSNQTIPRAEVSNSLLRSDW